MTRNYVVLIVLSIVIPTFYGSFEPAFSARWMQTGGSEPELHMNVYNSSAWVRDSRDRPMARCWFNIVVWNSGNATAYSVDVEFSLLKYGYSVENGTELAGNIGKDESWNTTKTFELNDGYYEMNLTLRTPTRIWENVFYAFEVSFPRDVWTVGGELAQFYVTPRDPIVQNIVNYVGKDVDSLYSWVGDNIRYVYDNVSHGVSDYWQLPYETLNLTTGDCEDVAFLLCSLVRAAGVSAENAFVAVGTVDDGGHAWVIHGSSGAWRSLEPTANGFIDRLFVDLWDFFGLFDRKYYSAFNDVYYEKINYSTNKPYVYQTFSGWCVNGSKMQGSRVTVEKGQPVTLMLNVTNLGYYKFIGFVKIEINKYIVWGDSVFDSINYSLVLYPGESRLLNFTFVPDETTGSAPWQCRHYYYKVYTCFACIHGPPDADLRECLYVLSRILPTDLNKDGKVNILDVTIAAIAYKSKPGDLNWNEAADIDKNGVIDIMDITKVAVDYGKTTES